MSSNVKITCILILTRPLAEKQARCAKSSKHDVEDKLFCEKEKKDDPLPVRLE